MNSRSQKIASTRKTPGAPPFEIPNPPNEFGQDGGGFYGAYDELANEVDEDLVESLKGQLDGMLVFAGLFAGVNSAFLALTLPLLSSDPSDDTNALLAQNKALLAQNNAILLQLITGRNDTDTVPTESALPSTTFSPSPNTFITNLLFGLSLALAIMASFLAVLGRQWLVYYRKRGGGGPDRERWNQLKRFLGAKRWHLELILDDILPFLLQSALMIFCVSFIIYLHHLNPTLSLLVGIPMYVGLLILLGSAVCTLWDRFCPFHSPLSHLLRWAVKTAPFALRASRRAIVSGYKSIATRFLRNLRRITRTSNDTRDRESEAGDTADQTTRRLQLENSKPWLQTLAIGREEESEGRLQVITLQRAICTSDDPRTLLYAASNILGIGTADQMAQLWNNKNFPERFFDQFQKFHDRVLQLGGDQTKTASAMRLYCAAVAHGVLLLEIGWEDLTGFVAAIRMVQEISVWIPEEQLSNSSPSFIRATLAFTMFQFFTDSPSPKTVNNLYSHLSGYSDYLKHGDWRLFCLVSWAVANLTVTQRPSLNSLRKAYRGDFNEAVQTLQGACEVLVPECKEHVACERILSNMLQFSSQIIVDNAQSNVTMKQKSALSERWEQIMLNTVLPDATRQIARKLTINLAQAWERECQQENISEELLDTITRYLLTLRIKYKVEPLAVYHEYIEVLQLFGPAIRGLLSRKPNASHVETFARSKRNLLRNTFNEMVSDAAGISLQIQQNARRIRDPDVRWCHLQREPLLVTTQYSLTSDPSTALRGSGYQRYPDILAPYPDTTE